MSLAYFDSMDTYSSDAGMISAGWGVNGADDVYQYTSGGRLGGGRVRVTDDASSPSAYRRFSIAGSTVFFQIGFKTDRVAEWTSSHMLLSFNNNSGTNSVASLGRWRNGEITAHNSVGTRVAISDPGVVKSGIWQYLQVKVVSHPSAGSILVKVDGVEVINVTGVDTSISVTSIDTIVLRSASWTGAFGTSYDDMVILDDAGSAPLNGFIDDVAIISRFTNADTAQTDWTLSSGSNGYELINDPVGNDDGDATYIHTSGYGSESLFELEDMSDDPDTIYGVNIVTSAKEVDSPAYETRPYMDSGGTVDYGSYLALTTTYKLLRQIWENDPDTGFAWQKAAIDALEIGCGTTPP